MRTIERHEEITGFLGNKLSECIVSRYCLGNGLNNAVIAELIQKKEIDLWSYQPFEAWVSFARDCRENPNKLTLRAFCVKWDIKCFEEVFEAADRITIR